MIGYVDVDNIIVTASNVRPKGNPSFTVADFLEVYPQFTADVIPEVVVQLYIDMATACVSAFRFKSMWKLAMCYFIAHFCSTFIKTSSIADKDSIVAVAQSQGIPISESVDGVSYTVDVSSIASDLAGYGDFKTTQFGISFATMAKMVGKGGMVVP